MPLAPASAVDASLVAGLRMAIARLARRLRQQAEGGVSASQLSALATIERLGPISLGDLATVEKVQPPTMTKVVAKLAEMGFVVREVDDRDRRVVRVHVSDTGRRYVARSRTRKDQYLAERLRGFDADERALLARALPLLERLVDDDR